MYITLESMVSAGASSYVETHAESSARRTLEDNSYLLMLSSLASLQVQNRDIKTRSSNRLFKQSSYSLNRNQLFSISVLSLNDSAHFID